MLISNIPHQSKLTRGSNKAQDARLDIHARGFWEPQRSAFFDLGFVTRMLNPIGTSSRSKCIVYTRMRKSVNTLSRVLDFEHGTFTLLIFYNWWNGKGLLELPQQTSRVDYHQERRGLRQKYLMDTSKNLLCTSEICINLSQRN